MAGSEEAFVKRMNERAVQLGLQNTHFVNSNGLPSSKGEHYSTAYDIATLSRHALRVPLLMDLVSTYHYVIRPGRKNEVVLWNYNRMLERTMSATGRSYGYPGLDGIKTGSTTEAGYCLRPPPKVRICASLPLCWGQSRAPSGKTSGPSSTTVFESTERKWSQGKGSLGPSQGQAGRAEQVSIVANPSR